MSAPTCPTPGCDGDARYSPPGCGHAPFCDGSTPAPDRDAAEREALAEDLHGDCYEGLDPAAKREVDRLLAAGWSRSPRPAAVSEEAVEAAARAMFEDGLGDYTWAEMVSEDAGRADIWRDDARRVLAAALPHLAPGQSEAEVLQGFVDHVAQAAAHNGADDPGQAFYDDGLNPWLQRVLAGYLARTAPAEDGAE